MTRHFFATGLTAGLFCAIISAEIKSYLTGRVTGVKEPMTLIERLETIGMVVMILAWILLVFKIFFDKIIQYEFYAGICLFFLIASFCFALSSPIIYSLGMLPPAVVSWILYWDSKLTYQKQVRGGIKR